MRPYFLCCLIFLGALHGSSLRTFGAPIVIYGTGVDDAGFLLPDNVDDLHYNVISAPPNGSTGPSNASSNIPSPPWISNGPTSRWVVPPGLPVSDDTVPFVFQHTFNITSPLVSESYVLMRVSSDNFLQSISLNGNATGITYDGNFAALSAQVAMQRGFVQGANIVEFPVINATPNDNPVGLRVDIVDAYQPPANHVPIPGLINTGTDTDEGPALPHGSAVASWALTSSPLGTNPITVHTSVGAFPIPPWLSDTTSSAWIGPDDPDINGPAGEDQYSISFDLTSFDLDSVIIRGLWATDDGGVGIFLNGVDTGNFPSVGFTENTFFSLSVEEGDSLQSGSQHALLSAQQRGGPTGFRAEFLTATGIVPEPGALSLFLAGGLLLRRRHSFQKSDSCGAV